MSYYLSRTVDAAFDEVVQRVTAALKEEGFGVLTDIDVQATLKAKLGADVPPYRILGACNPSFAHQALQVEDKLGVLLPCNFILRDCGVPSSAPEDRRLQRPPQDRHLRGGGRAGPSGAPFGAR